MSIVSLSRQRSLYRSFATRTPQLLQRDLARLQEQLSTGKRINRASDDASAFGQARQLEALSHRYEQYQGAIDAARPWVNRTQQELDQLAERFTEAYEEALRGANDTASPDDRETIARRLESIKEEVVDHLNATSGSEYLFGGNRTTAAPFDANGDPNVPYAQISGERNRQIGPGLEIAINIAGDEVHQTGEGFTITEGLQNMIDALRGTGPLSIEEALDQVTTARDHLVDLGAEAGNISRRLDLSESQLRETTLVVEGQRSRLEDTDFLEATTEFQRTQGSLEAALRVSATVLQTSLLDFLQ